MRPIVKNSTNQSVVIRIIDSEDGTPENGVVWNTAGIDLWYRREGAVKVSITEATLATLDAAHSDGGFLLIGDGYYRLDLPDAAVAAGENGVTVGGMVTGMIVIGCYVPLVDYDPYDSVRAGLTALPPAAADAAGGLPISDAGGLDLDTKLATTDQIGAAGVGLTEAGGDGDHLTAINLPNQTMDITGNITGNLSGSVGSVTGAVGSVTGNVDGNVAGSVGSVTGAVGSVTGAVGSVAGNVDGNVAGTVAGKTPAEAGDAMGLSDDAITSAKFDETTAFPVKSADTGATQIARVGADGDTLETLSDQIDGVGGGGGDATEANQTTIINHLTDVKGGTFNSATDSLEAIRDRGDAAWITGGGGALTEILNIQPLVPNSIDLADTATVRIGLGLTNMLDDLPGTAEITPGTIKIERKAFGGTTWSTVVSDAACSELAGLVYYDEVFDSGSGYAQGDSIRVTFKNQKITVAANDFEITGSDGWPFQTYLRDPLLTQTGVTEGGTWTLAKWLKVQIALAGGKFQDKSGVSGTYEILDPDDGTTVIAEAIPSETSPYWQITVLI